MTINLEEHFTGPHCAQFYRVAFKKHNSSKAKQNYAYQNYKVTSQTTMLQVQLVILVSCLILLSIILCSSDFMKLSPGLAMQLGW